MTLITFSTTQLTAFRTAFEAINSLIPDANLEFSKDGLLIRDLDKTNTILVSARFEADKFDNYSYDCLSDKYNIGVVIENLVKCIKCNLSYDVITITIEDTKDTKPKLKIVMTSKDRNETKTCYPKLTNIVANTNNIKTMSYPSKITLQPSVLNKHIKDINHICDSVVIKLFDEGLLLMGYQEDEMAMVQALNKNNKMEIILDDETKVDDIEKKVIVKNLMLLNRCVNLANQVSIYIPSKKTKDPLVIEYPLASLGNMRLVYVR